MKSDTIPRLRFLCFGVGAIGTYIGGSLVLAGQKVVFVERPEIAQALRQQGLTLEIKGQSRRVADPDIVSSIDEALTRGPFDVAIAAVKSFDTAKLLESLRPYSVALPPVLSFQNGVENETLLAQELGPSKVIAGTVTSAIGKVAPGHIVVERLRGVGVASEHILVPSLVAVLNLAGLNACEYASAASMKWSKLLTNLLANATSAILDMTPREIFRHPGLYRLEIQQLREALQVMRAQKVNVVDLPSTPVRLLRWLALYLPPSLSRPLLQQAVGAGRGGKMPSFHIDLYSGRGQSEVDSLNGAVVRAGERLGIPTPVNRLLRDVLLALTCGELPLSRFARKPDRLLELLRLEK